MNPRSLRWDTVFGYAVVAMVLAIAVVGPRVAQIAAGAMP